MRVRVNRLGHIGITVQDLDRSVAFYTEVLGMRLTERFEYPAEEVGHGTAVAAGAFVRCNATHHVLSIFRLKDQIADGEAGKGQIASIGLHHIAFELGTPAELIDAYHQLRDAGVEIVNARRGGPGNQPRFYARDPDGHLLEFYWGIDEIGWDGIARSYDPIQAIDLADFDFDEFIRARDEASASMRETVADTASTDDTLLERPIIGSNDPGR